MGFLPSGQQWTIKADGYEAVVVEVGGGLRAYGVDGAEMHRRVRRRTSLPPASAGQVLAPVAQPHPGRPVHVRRRHRTSSTLTEPARHNAIHGLVNWVRWRELDVAADAVTLGYDAAAAARLPVAAGAAQRVVGRAGRAARRPRGDQPGRRAGAVRLLRAPVPAGARRPASTS